MSDKDRNMFQQLIRHLAKPYCYLRFGKITEVVVDRINGIPCEICYLDRNGKEVGYWAYGHFDPRGPYRGWLH